MKCFFCNSTGHIVSEHEEVKHCPRCGGTGVTSKLGRTWKFGNGLDIRGSNDTNPFIPLPNPDLIYPPIPSGPLPSAWVDVLPPVDAVAQEEVHFLEWYHVGQGAWLKQEQLETDDQSEAVEIIKRLHINANTCWRISTYKIHKLKPILLVGGWACK